MGRAKAPLAILAVCITSLSAFLWWTLQPAPVAPLSAAEEPAPRTRTAAAKPAEPTLGQRIRGVVQQVTGTQPEPAGFYGLQDVCGEVDDGVLALYVLLMRYYPNNNNY